MLSVKVKICFKGGQKVGLADGVLRPDITVYYTLGLDPQTSVFQVR